MPGEAVARRSNAMSSLFQIGACVCSLVYIHASPATETYHIGVQWLLGRKAKYRVKVLPSPCTSSPRCSESPNVMRSVSNIMKFNELEIAARYSVKNRNATELQPKKIQ